MVPENCTENNCTRRKAMKTCTKCGAEKVEKEFSARETGKNKLRAWCKACMAEYGRHYSRINIKRKKEWSRNWRRKNRFKKALKASCDAAMKYGYVPCTATIQELKATFTGCCAICGVSEEKSSRKLAMDHSHLTGRFRGWLCWHCNQGLGRFKDSRKLLSVASKYLKEANDKHRNRPLPEQLPLFE